MGFSVISDYPNIGKNISGLLNHLKISIAKNKNTKIIEITKIVLPSLSCLKVLVSYYFHLILLHLKIMIDNFKIKVTIFNINIINSVLKRRPTLCSPIKNLNGD